MNVTLLEPDATVTVAGTVATAGVSLDNVTTPPVVEFSVTVPVEIAPPTTAAGFSTSGPSGAMLDLNPTTTEDSPTAAVVVPVAV